MDKNFQDWAFKKQAGALKFSEEQMDWLRMMKSHIAASFHFEADDLEYTPFDAEGGKGQLFGEEMEYKLLEDFVRLGIFQEQTGFRRNRVFVFGGYLRLFQS